MSQRSSGFPQCNPSKREKSPSSEWTTPLDSAPSFQKVNHMVNSGEARMDAVFAALSDRTRRGMIRRLSRGPASVGELGRPYAISKPAVTKHLKVLERAGLVQREKNGRVHRCTLDPSPMREAEVWIERYRAFWEGSLEALARFVEDTPSQEGEER